MSNDYARHAAARKAYEQRRAYATGAAIYAGAKGMSTEKSFNFSDLFDATNGQEVERSKNFWKPTAVSEILCGQYVGKKDGAKYGSVATILTPDGQLVPVGLNAVLEDLLPGTLVGEYVAIQYTGKLPTVNGEMRTFRVKTLPDADTAAALWSKVSAYITLGGEH